MRNRIPVLGAAALLLCTAAEARAEGRTLRVAIPFTFDAGGHELAAGTDSFEHVAHRSLLVITAPGGGRIALSTLPEAPSSRTDRTEVVFRQSGNGWRLAAIAVAGASHRALVPAGKERQRSGQARRAEAATVPSSLQ